MDPVQYVDVILSKHSKFKALVDKAFQNDNNFVAAMDKVCSSRHQWSGGAGFCIALRPQQSL
jgi:hypothetical protein